MSEGDFWNNLDSFVEQKNASSASGENLNGREHEKVGDWLKSIPDLKQSTTTSTPIETK